LRSIFDYNPKFGYQFIPNLKVRIQNKDTGYLIKTNKSGFRCNHNFEKKKTPGTKRILIFGDSFTAGDGVSNNQRYSDILESKFNNVEVYNFGLSGTGPDQHYLIYKELAKNIEHDLLVISVLVENIRRVAAHYRFYLNDKEERVCYAKPYFTVESDKLRLNNVPPQKSPIDMSTLDVEEKNKIDKGQNYPVLGKILTKTKTLGLVQKILNHQPYPQYDSEKNPDWIIMEKILTEWISNHSEKVVLVPLPFYFNIEELCDSSSYRKRFSALAQKLNCFYHDPLGDFQKYPMKKRRNFRFKTDVHYSPKGHEILANSLFNGLKNILGV
tara:strand:+ start:679 stop:1659 length:981 start_codon:yes stop_codon:yes gene_type:complete